MPPKNADKRAGARRHTVQGHVTSFDQLVQHINPHGRKSIDLGPTRPSSPTRSSDPSQHSTASQRPTCSQCSTLPQCPTLGLSITVFLGITVSLNVIVWQVPSPTSQPLKNEEEPNEEGNDEENEEGIVLPRKPEPHYLSTHQIYFHVSCSTKFAHKDLSSDLKIIRLGEFKLHEYIAKATKVVHKSAER
jgi:hypothetical protein